MSCEIRSGHRGKRLFERESLRVQRLSDDGTLDAEVQLPNKDGELRMHGNDERISLANLRSDEFFSNDLFDFSGYVEAQSGYTNPTTTNHVVLNEGELTLPPFLRDLAAGCEHFARLRSEGRATRIETESGLWSMPTSKK